MKLKHFIFALLLFMVCVSTATAKVPDNPNTTFWSTKEWIVADGTDSTQISLKVINQSSPITGLTVKFRLNDTGYGQFVQDSVVTDLDGVASTQLKARTKSGTVTIYADVFYRINDADFSEILKNATYSFAQKIDHATPYAITSDTFPNGLVQVGTEIPIVIRIGDYWNNVVDGRNSIEKINMSIQGSPVDGAYLKTTGTWVKNIEVPVDQAGNFIATLKLSTKPGFHSILVTPVGMPISEKAYYVRGIANGTPSKITSRVEIAEGGTGSSTVDPPYIEADGFSRYFITYTLYDQYDNPVSDQRLNFSTTISGEQQYLPASTDQGEVKIYYGPKDQVGIVTLHVSSLTNSSITKDNVVKFINSTATEMLLTANPETMPSRDVAPDFTADVIAKVVDENGNGVPNQSVTFSIGTPAYAETYTVTSAPSIDTSSAISDSDGYATVLFTPGGFTTNWADSHFDETATGRVNVTAVWNSTPHAIMLTWKNYPYLSAETYVSPNIVNVTDNVTVTLRLKGDGWALQPNPIDAMLVIDRSGSMVFDDPDRMYSVREAAKVFVDSLSGIRDRVGLVTFGRNGFISRAGVNSGIDISEVDNVYIVPRTYNDYATLDKSMTFNSTDVKIEFDKIVPDHGTPMRKALKVAIDNMRANGRTKAVKAIIILSDGDYNWYGDPLRRDSTQGQTSWSATDFGNLDDDWYKFSDLNTTDQNMSRYAKDYGIKIYSIAFADDVSSGGKETLEKLALGAGGKYYEASATNIADVYTAIAGDLKTEAGVDTKADLKYQSVYVNQLAVNDVFNYTYKNPVSSMNRTYWTSNNTNILGPYYYDQTADYLVDKILSFNAGTIKLNQSWETTYMLQVNKPGNIDVFGIGSTISFNNNTSILLLPKTLITALPNMNTTGQVNVTKTLTIDNLSATKVGNDNSTIYQLAVDVQILPSSPNLTVIADIYITDEDQHTTTWIKSVTMAPIVNGRMEITTIDLSKYQLGKQYTFYVDFVNKQPGTNPVYWAQLTSNRFIMQPKPVGVYIRLD
jgi:Mg-chelatase subunit ChlD